MHLIAAQGGRIDDGDEAVDLDQSPGDILVLSAADTELAAFAEAAETFDGPSVRIASILALQHPMSIDLYCDKTVSKARVVFVRLLGGRNYWRYGLERLEELARRGDVSLIVLPGDAKPDDDLRLASGVSDPVYDAFQALAAEGGLENSRKILELLHALLEGRAENYDGAPARFDVAGIYDPVSGPVSLQDFLDRNENLSKPAVPVVFYRALLQGGSPDPVQKLAAALSDRGLLPVPVFAGSLKDPVCADIVAAIFEAVKPVAILNATGFSLRGIGSADRTVLDRSGVPVLQVVFSGSAEDSWRENPQGLAMRDLAMNVVLPELDGRIMTRAVSFKEQGEFRSRTEFRPVRYRSLQDRIDFVAEYAARTAKLAATPVAEKPVAFILANYPNRDGRIANGVGLDTPESMAVIGRFLKENGYSAAGLPDSGKGLMEVLLAGPTNRLEGREQRAGGVLLSLEDYQEAFSAFPETARAEIAERWGKPEEDPMCGPDGFHLGIHQFGNIFVGIQPARGYNIDPKETYHSPDLVPPHNYLAFYVWLGKIAGVQAVVHLGKHGNLEWLPGKAAGLSSGCWPELAFLPVPHFYPFIVNDPGEGTQAKRRTHAAIIDHLTPPLTRAENYGASETLETLLDEYMQAVGGDPRRAAYLLKEILHAAQRDGFSKDCGIDDSDDDATALQKLDAHLCDLKELQIRDGLHIFGRSPEGQELTDLVTAVSRVPVYGSEDETSLHRAIASDLGLDDFDPLTADFAQSYDGPRPDSLLSQSDDLWRSNGDTVERIEKLAHALVGGETVAPPEWTATGTVLSRINTIIRPAIEQSGSAEIEALLNGLDGRFIEPGPSGAPSRGRADVLPTGRNFYSVDNRAIPTRAAWELGKNSARLVVDRYFQEEGEFPVKIALTAWGTSNMRTGGDDIAQALALIGAKPVWEGAGGRVTGFEIIPLSDLQRPRVDVTLRISGFFRDAFPQQIDLFDSAVRAISALAEPEDANPIAANVRAETSNGVPAKDAAGRIYGSRPGAYGAGLQAMIDEKLWNDQSDLADAFLEWGGYRYGGGTQGARDRSGLERRLSGTDLVMQNQDNREHDLLDSDDYYQFEGGMTAAVKELSGSTPKVFHNDHSRPERPVVRSLEEELGRVVRGRAANPKWISGVMRHGYKGAFEIAASVDYLFAFAAATGMVSDHHFDQLYSAYLEDEKVLDFMRENNPAALREMADRFLEALERNLWSARSNTAYNHLTSVRDEI